MSPKFLSVPTSSDAAARKVGSATDVLDQIEILDVAGQIAIVAAVWLLLFNVIAFYAFRADKHRAVAGEWRISEAALLSLALLGGWFGAKLGQRKFRHKTRKEPFRSLLNVIPAIQIFGLGVLWVLTR